MDGTFSERHHPRYWDGSTKKVQTFFDKDATVDDITESISQVISANREKLLHASASRDVRLTATLSDGFEYKLTLDAGRVVQFYPK